MCLCNITDKEEAKVLAKLSDTFPCWKAMQNKEGKTFFGEEDEPKLVRGNEYKAGDFGVNRRFASYVGFHVFLKRKHVESFIKYWNDYLSVRPDEACIKFYANKADIVKVGMDNSGNISVAVSKITRK